MARGVITFVACFGALLAAFLVYRQTMVIVPVGAERPATFLAGQRTQENAGGQIEIASGDVALTIPPQDGVTQFTFFEPMTGRMRETISFRHWSRVAGTNNEIRVQGLELTRHLDNNVDISVRALEGQFVAEGIEQRQPRPKRGWVAGEATIEIRRFGSDAGPDDPPTHHVVIHADRIEFDVDRSDIRAVGPIRVDSDDVLLRGRDMRLIWNQTDNRVEFFELQGAGEFVLRSLDDPALGVANRPAQDVATDPRRAERVTTYQCVLSGGVSAVQVNSNPRGRSVGEEDGDEAREAWNESQLALFADRLELLFDVARVAETTGRRTDSGAAAPSAATDAEPIAESAAGSPPQPDSKELIVAWSDRLEVTPLHTITNQQRGTLRRRLKATGDAVQLASLGGETQMVECGELRFHADTQRLWLNSGASGAIGFSLGPGLGARAGSVYADFAANVVKLVGDVRLSDRRGRGAVVTCDLWAELRLAQREDDDCEPGEAAGLESAFRAGYLRSADFVGNARVREGESDIRAHRLSARFRPPTPEAPEAARRDDPRDSDGSLAALDIDHVVGSGGVRVRSGERRMRAAWVNATYRHEDDHSWPERIEALGDVRLYDLGQEVAAGGRRLTALVSPDNQVMQADVEGSTRRPARIVAQGYDVRSQRITMREAPQDGATRSERTDYLLEAPGPVRLRFASDSGLRGRPMTRSGSVVDVSAAGRMRIDTRSSANLVEFEGGVLARSGDESLQAERLTMYMRDELTPAQPPRGLAVVRQLGMQLWDRIRDRSTPTDGASFAPIVRGDSLRKEAVRLVADRALVMSEEFTGPETTPTIEQSIEAPRLVVELAERRIHTLGRTILLMTSRRLGEDQQPTPTAEPGPLGMPSTLISRGPSQTVLQCNGSMNYVLGEDGSARTDRVLFEGDVRFLHLAGRAIPNLLEVVPALSTRQERIARLPNRNAYLASDQLEVVLDMGSDDAGTRNSGRLAWLNATGNVLMEDTQDSAVRRIDAHQLEFDQTSRTVRAFGREQARDPARIFFEDPANDRFDEPAVGYSFTVFLENNTVRSGAVRGTFRP